MTRMYFPTSVKSPITIALALQRGYEYPPGKSAYHHNCISSSQQWCIHRYFNVYVIVSGFLPLPNQNFSLLLSPPLLLLYFFVGTMHSCHVRLSPFTNLSISRSFCKNNQRIAQTAVIIDTNHWYHWSIQYQQNKTSFLMSINTLSSQIHFRFKQSFMRDVW